MRTMAGLTFFFMGIGTADSDNLLIPLALLAIGAILLRKDIGKNGN